MNQLTKNKNKKNKFQHFGQQRSLITPKIAMSINKTFSTKVGAESSTFSRKLFQFFSSGLFWFFIPDFGERI